MNDYELVYLAQEHVDEARDILYKEYRGLINSFVSRFLSRYSYLQQLDYDDIEIECLLVFERAIDSFNQDKNSSFKSYLWICLESKLKDVLRAINSKKNSVNKYLISWEREVNGISLADVIYDTKDLVEDNITLESCKLDSICNEIEGKLSKKEMIIFNLLVSGYLPDEIALIIGSDRKKVYNAIYRLKIKVRKYFGGIYGK